MFSFNMPTFFNNYNCGLDNMFMPFNSFSFDMFSFTPQTSLFQMPMMNFSQPSFNWNNFNSTSIWNFNNFSAASSSIKSSSSSSSYSSNGIGVLRKAQSYVGKVNSDAEGNRLFSPKNYKSSAWYKQHGSWGWCSDFATYCAAETLGSKYPSSMKTSSPQGLISAAKNNNCYSNGWSSNAKPGDILITKGSGPSGLHVSVLKSINGDGTITCISGNSKNSVRESNYKTSNVKGTVHISKLA